MSITVTGLDSAQKRFEDISKRLNDLTPVLNVVAADTTTLIQDSIRNSVSPDGLSYPSLKNRIGTPLINTGTLRNSITSRATSNSFIFGTNVSYAPFQQWGSHHEGQYTSGKKSRRGSPWAYDVPARPFLPIRKSGSTISLMNSGPAGNHWNEAWRAISRYISTGELI